MGRRLAIGAGALAAVVLASLGGYLLFNWRDVATAYHRRRLERDSGHLERILDSPDGSPGQAAVQRYLAEPEGAQHLLRLYVSALLSVLDSRAKTFRDTDRVALVYDPDGSLFGRKALFTLASQSPSRSVMLEIDDDRLPRLHRLVQERGISNYAGTELEGHQDLVFRVVRAPWASIMVGSRDFPLIWRETYRFVCVVQGKNAADPAPPDPIVVPFLLEALASEVPGESELAREALVRLGCDPDDPVPCLLDPRYLSVAALSVVDAAHLPRLLDALDHDDPRVRGRVLEALIKRKLTAETAIPVYLAAARDEDVEMRDTAVQGLEELGPAAIPALLRLLEDGSERMHFRALNAIGRFGTLAKPAIPALLVWIDGHPNPHLRKKVAEVIRQIDPDDQVLPAISRERENETAPR